jgi:hypothetical protein
LPGKITVKGGAQRVGAEIYVTSCDLGIFVDQAAEPVSPQDSDRTSCGLIGSPGRWVLVQRPVWPVGVVVIDVVASGGDRERLRCPHLQRRL